MDILNVLNENFESGGYLVSVFEHKEKNAESRERAFLEARCFIEENLGTDTKFIWFREKDAPDYVCGSIFVSGCPDIVQMSKKGFNAGMMDFSEEKIPRLADYINREAKGKFEMSANCC